MSDNSKIEWTDATWNPVRGCTRISSGCGGPNHQGGCYAEKIAARFSGKGEAFEGFAERGPHGGRWTGKVALVEDKLTEPLSWKKPRRIFVNSMSDLFHEALPDEAIDCIFAVMALSPQHTFQILTKRPERMRAYCSDYSIDARDRRIAAQMKIGDGAPPGLWPLPNVWLGTSIEDQATADERVPLLLATPAAVRFVSAEPLLGPIDLTPKADKTYQRLSEWYGPNGFDPTGSRPRRDRMTGYFPRVDWVIVGGESGPRARPMHPDWARSLRDQCNAAGVAFFFKQWGEWQEGSGFSVNAKAVLRDGRVLTATPVSLAAADREKPVPSENPTMMLRVGKARAGRLLDGREWNEFPIVPAIRWAAA